MEPTEQARRWQQRLDEDFPHGMVVTVPEADKLAFTIPRPEVVAMHGLNPVVFLDSPGYDRNFAYEILSYAVEQDSPCRLARVTATAGEGGEEVLLFSGNLSPAQVAMLRPDRHHSLLMSREGRVYKGDAWFAHEEEAR